MSRTDSLGSAAASKPLRLSVSALIEDDAGRYLLLKRAASSAHFAGEWEPPGGKIDPHEPFDAALRREVKEETGLDVVLLGAAGVTEFEIERLRIIQLHIVAQASSTHVRISKEHTEYAWVHPGDFDRVDLCPKLRNWRELVCTVKEDPPT